MTVAAIFTSRAVSTSIPSATTRSAITLSSRTTTSPSGRKQIITKHRLPLATTGRCLSSTTSSVTNNTQQSYLQQSYKTSNTQDGNESSFIRNVIFGLASAGAVGVGTTVINEDMTSNCESNDTVSTFPRYYTDWKQSLRSILSLDDYMIYDGTNNVNIHDKENIQPKLTPQSSHYQPSNPVAIPGRVIDVVKASVDTASEWEKKAKETVMRIAGPYPLVYDVSVRALRGGRLAMEDKYCIHNDGRFAAVFDGHGGSCVSTYLSKTLYQKINRHLKHNEKASHDGQSVSALMRALRVSFQEVEEEVLKQNDYQYQGSTAVAVWVHEDGDKGRTLISANIGDSRAVMSQKGLAVELTKDHKPDDVDEKKRIQAMGEKIEWDPYSNVYRVRNLSLSRAIGDKFAKPAVSSEVDIKTFPIKQNCGDDDFVILASDGLWDVMTSQECVNYINERLNASNEQLKNMSALEAQHQKFTKRRNMSRFVANEALRRGSCDNVCVIIVWLNKPDATLS